MLKERKVVFLLVLATTLLELASAARLKRQAKDDSLCCQCEKTGSGCQSDVRDGSRVSGSLTCTSQENCLEENGFNFELCDKCDNNFNEIDTGRVITCDPGYKPVCHRIDTNLVLDIDLRIGLAGGNPLGIPEGSPEVGVCRDEKLKAVADLSQCQACGKRDSSLYKHVDKPPTFTNPGEWPWVAMLFTDKDEYLGAGAYVAKDTVITVAHKVRSYQSRPSGLKVRLGDWKPNSKEESFDFVEHSVACLKIHPQADLDDTLANNVAVLKLGEEIAVCATKKVADVINLKSACSESSGGIKGYNAVCLPSGKFSPQFSGRFGNPDRCWVAAWGNNLDRQREIDLPLVNAPDCARRLGPTFRNKGVPNWRPESSELCAGGEVGKDTCQGEGGAPLVCLDKETDAYVAVGLVNYGFSCNSSLPAVYTNLMDPSVNRFIKTGFTDDFC